LRIKLKENCGQATEPVPNCVQPGQHWEEKKKNVAGGPITLLYVKKVCDVQ
jgi:hypothetical protein